METLLVNVDSASSESLLAIAYPPLDHDVAPLGPRAASRPKTLTPDAFFHRAMLGLTAALAIASVIGLGLTGMKTLPLSLVLRAAPAALVLAGIGFYRWRGVRRLEDLLTVVFWSLVLGILYVPLMYLAARLPVPCQDDLLARLDRAFGAEVTDVLTGVAALPRAKQALSVCYDTLLFLVTGASMVLPTSGRMRRAKEYLIAGVAAAALSIPIFALLPARGPWCHYGYPPTPEQEKVTQIIDALKNSDGFVINFLAPEGVISFPSFHTILALLAAYALWAVPYVRWPVALLAGLIVLSTVTTGWHYLVDVGAGVLVAVTSCAAGKAYTRWETCWTGPRPEPNPVP